MLQFWKRSGQKEKARSSQTSSPTRSTPPSSPSMSNGYIVNSFEETHPGLLASFEDEGLYENEISKLSRLSKTLDEVLAEKSALNYFIQYMEAQGALSYIRCWLDVLHFKSLTSNPATKDDEHDSLSVSTDCDSYTADTNSLFEYNSNTTNANSHATTNNNNCDRQGSSSSSGSGSSSGNCDKNSDISVKLKIDKCNASETSSEKSNITRMKIASQCQNSVKVHEALKIFKKYIALEATDSIKCPETERIRVIEAICKQDGIFDITCFDRVQKLMYDTLERDYFEAFLHSDYYCKLQIDVLTSGNIVLEDILYNETALFYFMEFLEQEGSRSLLDFWLAATNFHNQVATCNGQDLSSDPAEVQNDAVILYDKYFSLQATCPLGFSDTIRFSIEQNICSETGPKSDCFEQPLRIVSRVLEKNYLKPFLTSQLFFKYLSELINTVQTNNSTKNIEKHRRTYSDCSSDISTSANNFLAIENPSRNRVNTRKGTDMNIDTVQLYDPDSLWRRRRRLGLSFGRITELGRFETDFEPEPDKKNQFKITSVVKKLVNLPEDKTKEEMAWQVAEMIVKDITSVTMQGCEDLKRVPT